MGPANTLIRVIFSQFSEVHNSKPNDPNGVKLCTHDVHNPMYHHQFPQEKKNNLSPGQSHTAQGVIVHNTILCIIHCSNQVSEAAKVSFPQHHHNTNSFCSSNSWILTLTPRRTAYTSMWVGCHALAMRTCSLLQLRGCGLGPPPTVALVVKPETGLPQGHFQLVLFLHMKHLACDPQTGWP